MKPRSSFLTRIFILSSLLLLNACVTVRPPQDYSAFRRHKPQSILVLPPLNESVEVKAPYTYLSTITRPLAECGYYVFPVAVIDAFLKENGLPTPGEMHTIPLQKIHEIIGADAVLYVTIEDWGQKYKVLSSNTVIKARASLVHVQSGETLWTGYQNVVRSSDSGGNGLIGALISALVTQIINSMTDPTHALSKQANHMMVYDQNNGFLRGKYFDKEPVSEQCGAKQ